jgi:hypothetical protein
MRMKVSIGVYSKKNHGEPINSVNIILYSLNWSSGKVSGYRSIILRWVMQTKYVMMKRIIKDLVKIKIRWFNLLFEADAFGLEIRKGRQLVVSYESIVGLLGMLARARSVLLSLHIGVHRYLI